MLAVGVTLAAGAAPFIVAQLGGAADPGPTVDQVHASGCVPSFSLLTDRAVGPTTKTVTNNGSGSCAGVEIYVSHDGPDGEPVVYGRYVLGADGGTVEVDPSHAVCAKRTRRDGNRVVDDPNGDVQWDAFTVDPTGLSSSFGRFLLTAAWLPYPGCPQPAPTPTTPPTAPPTVPPTAPPTPSPTNPPAPTTPPVACPPGQVGPPAPGCPPDVAPTVPQAPPTTRWEPPPSTIVGTPPCPPVGPPGGPFNPSCPPQGAYQP